VAHSQSGYHATMIGSPSAIFLDEEYFEFSVRLLESLYNAKWDESCHPSPYSVAAFDGRESRISRTALGAEDPVQVVAINHFMGV
jgi:hypothetical protein